jgi:hypothetical protein
MPNVANSTEIVSSLVTYGMMSDENLLNLKRWANDLFTEMQATSGGADQLLSSSVAGRTFTFASATATGAITVSDMFAYSAQALRVLSGRAPRKTTMRF